MAASLRTSAILAACSLALWLSTARGKQPVDYADPLIDSANSRWIFFSSACRPFAMVNLSPDTNPGPDAASNSGYCYHKGSICGLSHVHAWQLGGVSVMPVAGPVDPTAGPEAFRSPFRHDDEVCQPGYHAVTLDRYRIRVELTSTPRVGFHRYRFPAGDGPRGDQSGRGNRERARARRHAAAGRRRGGRRLPGRRADRRQSAAQALHGVFRDPFRPPHSRPRRLDRPAATGHGARGFGQGLRRDRAVRGWAPTASSR